MLTAIGILLVVLFDGTSDVLVTRAIKQLGEVRTFSPRALLHLAGAVLRKGGFLLGLGFATAAFVGFLALLSYNPLSLIFPATSLSYLVSMLGAKVVLRENVNALRLTGGVLVCVGVGLASLR